MKNELRERKKLEISGLCPEYIRLSDAGIEKKLLSLPEYIAAETVFIYFSIGSEVNTHGIIKNALAEGKRTALPVTLGRGEMYFAGIKSTDELYTGIYGIPEPGEDAKRLTPMAGDIIIVPALCADKNGNRIGHGGGYYDRFLAEAEAFSVCLCRKRLLEESIPTEETDVRVSLVLSE